MDRDGAFADSTILLDGKKVSIEGGPFLIRADALRSFANLTTSPISGLCSYPGV